VMRVSIEVPIKPDELNAVRQRNAAAMVQSIEDVMRANATNKPRLIVFPVLQLTSARRAVSGVPISAVAIDLVSEPLINNPILKPLIEVCQRHNCMIATSTQEKVPQLPGTHFHTGFIMGPEGLVLRSPKSQAQSAPEIGYLRDMKEQYTKIFGPDSIMPVKKTAIGTLGCFVEGEGEVLEVSRLLASKGCEVIAHVSLEDDEIPWQALKQAIGFQCHLYLLTGAASRLRFGGTREDEWSGGASTIVGPDGKVLASKGGKDEGFAVAEIDLAKIPEAKKHFGRNTVPAWSLYKELYSQ